MIHTQHGLRPSSQYDDDDYPLPLLKTERTLNEYQGDFAYYIGQLTDKHIALTKYSREGKLLHDYSYEKHSRVPRHTTVGTYLHFEDTAQCSLVSVKISKSTMMVRRVMELTHEQLMVEYGDVE